MAVLLCCSSLRLLLPDQRQNKDESMANSPKIADRPHMWTLVLSGGAIIVSVLSFFQSKQAVEFSREVSRAIVQVNSVRVTDTPERLTFLIVDLTLTNYGQVMARDVFTTLEWDVSEFDVPVLDATFVPPTFGDIAPKNSRTARLQGNRRFSGGTGFGGGPGLTRARSKLLVYGVAHYTDAQSGFRGSDPWCFLFDPRENAAQNSLNLRPCAYRPSDKP